MMNIVQTQDQLKNFSQEQLIKEMQMPSGTAPQFLILNEIMRRQKMQQDFAAQQGGASQTTVAEDAIAAAGVPQEGLAGMAQALAPQTDMLQNTGVGAVQQMYAGGPVKKMNEGDVVVRDGLQYVEGPDGQLYPQGGVGGLGTFEQDYGSMGSPTEPNPTIGERASSFFGFGPAFERIAENRPTPPAQDMTDLARQSAEDAAKLRETEGITESLKEPTRPQTPEVPVAPQGGGAGAGGAGGAGGMSSFEQELMSTLDRREKAAEQDKWLALAQVGLNMMSSTQPTLLGAVGEAGLKGVEAARGARDQYEKDRIELLGAMEQSRLARAAAAARAASGAQGTQSSGFGGLSASQGRLLTQINSDLTRLDSVLNDPLSVGMELTPEQELEREDAKDKRRQLEFLREQLMYGAALSAGSGDETTADLSD